MVHYTGSGNSGQDGSREIILWGKDFTTDCTDNTDIWVFGVGMEGGGSKSAIHPTSLGYRIVATRFTQHPLVKRIVATRFIASTEVWI